MLRALAFILFLCLFLNSVSQESNQLRIKEVLIITDTTTFDSLPVARGSLNVLSPDSFSPATYFIDYLHACIITPYRGKITLRYRVLQLGIPVSVKNKNRNIIINHNPSYATDQGYTPGNRIVTETDDESALTKNGAISRGIGIGNNQDLVLNSIFNLQLSGKLNKDWNILGSISDDNTQLQPDGTTLQLQEFDKVFIKLYSRNRQITVGDFEARSNPASGYFIRYYKRNRGMQLAFTDSFGTNSVLNYGVSAAAAKGRYTRQPIAVTDGIQGPYRLSGNNGEMYVLINAGSERIFIDDQLMTRGFDHDYTIDYNTGEVTFTARRLITANSRVVAEYQYTDRNYSRTVVTGFADWQYHKLETHFNYFQEKDLKNQPILQELTAAQKQLLASVGDSVQQAYTSSSKEVRVFTTEKILYRKTDTLGFQNVFVFATAPGTDTVFYEITFNEVGANKGHYRLIKSSANGKVYEFIPPVGGVLQGNAEPLQPLAAPQGLQNYSLGATYRFNAHQTVSVEAAFSNFNSNAFSRKNKEDDAGYAIHSQWEQHYPLSAKKAAWELSTRIASDLVQKNFRSAERFRDVNFSRGWNRQLQQTADASTHANEYNTLAEVQLSRKDLHKFIAGAEQFTREAEISGLKYYGNLASTVKKTTLLSDAEWMQSDLKLLAVNNHSRIVHANLFHAFPRITLGAEARKEESSFKNNLSDSLLNTSFGFTQSGVYLLFGSKRFQGRTEVQSRNDKAPEGTRLVQAFTTTIYSSGGTLSMREQTLQYVAQYKNIAVENPVLSRVQKDAALAFQLQHALTRFNLALQHTFQCNASSGREQQRIFTFVEVPAGRGVYAWRDYNGNGIKELNEFEQAYNADEAKFVRVLTPTQNFSKTNALNIYESLVLQPYRIWNKKAGVKGFLSRWEERITLKNELKQLAGTRLVADRWIPSGNDTTILNTNFYFENNLIFNRSFNPFDGRYNYRRNTGSSLLTYGIDMRNRYEHEVILRYTHSRIGMIQLFLLTGEKALTSQFFSARNYRFRFYSMEPRLSIELRQNFRLTLRSKYYTATDIVSDTVGTQNAEAGMDLHWYLSSKSFLDARASLIQIHYKGDINSTVGYEMMQGLTNGKNVLGTISFMQQVSAGMQVSINYNIRAAKHKPVIHTGGVEVRYIF